MTNERTAEGYRGRSLWLDGAMRGARLRASLHGRERADVVIIGGGLTGIWLAYTLSVDAPHLRVTVLEREVVGYGASGRNGGWVGGDLPGSPAVLGRQNGKESVRRAAEAMRDAIDEIGRVVADEAIDCGFQHAGTLWFAANRPQATRLSVFISTLEAQGGAGPGERMLTGTEVTQHVKVASAVAGHFSPHCASVDPARLVRGLADAAERRGVRILEKTAVVDISRGRVVTQEGAVEAEHIVIATEAWTSQLPGYRRSSLPLTSMMIATEPLPAHVWDELGWPKGLTVRDKAHLFLYAVRTEDDRIAIGGRGAPYRLSEPYSEFGDRDVPVWDRLRSTIDQQFPAARGASITHRWGGILGVPRDWTMSVVRSARTGAIFAGGYAGHGVTASNISGRTVADLILGRDTPLVRLPWVGHRPRRWEPEPARFLVANAMVKLLASADRYERAHGRMARRTALVKPFMPPG